VKGGQTIEVSAPIDTIPLFVRAGSILPMGSAVESTHQKQTIEQVRVYPGADGDFTLFSDDGTTYAYERGAGSVTRLHWSETAHRLTHEGPAAWSAPDSTIVEVVGR
jgi:alpha-glucosidase (family GH31 glycosyl hydrolase)